MQKLDRFGALAAGTILASSGTTPTLAANGGIGVFDGYTTGPTTCRYSNTMTVYYETNDGGGLDYYRIVLVDDNNTVLLRSGVYSVTSANTTTATPVPYSFTIDVSALPSYTGDLYITGQDVSSPSDPGGSLFTNNNSTTIKKSRLWELVSYGSACKSLFVTNSAPIADAGADIANVVPGSTVTLDASGSADPDNDALTYSWVQVSGPPVTLDDATSPTPSFTAPGGAGGTPIVFQLIVNDGTVSSAADTVTITVQDNIGAAEGQIDDFLAQRSVVLLGHQPDLQRRIDRLEGGKGARGGLVSVGGVPIPGTDKLPLSGSMGGGALAVSAGATFATGARTQGVAGTIDVWAELYASEFDFNARTGNTTILYGGVDYAVSPDLLVGVMGQYDDIGFDRSVTTGVLGGEGWMAGPYVTARLAPDLFADARVAFGQSDNTISPFGTYVDSFDSDRLLLSATLTGQFDLSPGLVLRPEADVRWLGEDSESYVDGVGSTISARETEIGQVSFAPRLLYSLPVGEGTDARPWVEARGIFNWGDLPGSFGGDEFRLRVEGGVDLLTASGVRAGLSGFHDGIGMDGYSASGVHVRVGLTF